MGNRLLQSLFTFILYSSTAYLSSGIFQIRAICKILTKSINFDKITIGSAETVGVALQISAFSEQEGTIFITFSLQTNKEGGVANGIFGNTCSDSYCSHRLHRSDKKIKQ